MTPEGRVEKKSVFFDAQPNDETVKNFWQASQAIAWCFNVESRVITLWRTVYWGHDKPEAATEHRHHDNEVQRDGGFYGYATRGSVITTSTFNYGGECDIEVRTRVESEIGRFLGPFDPAESARLRMMYDYDYGRNREYGDFD